MPANVKSIANWSFADSTLPCKIDLWYQKVFPLYIPKAEIKWI